MLNLALFTQVSSPSNRSSHTTKPDAPVTIRQTNYDTRFPSHR